MLLRDLIMDACAIMNLVAGEATRLCLERIDPKAQVSPVVEGECSNDDTQQSLIELIEEGLIERTDVEIAAEDLLAFMSRHDLGAGESEAILVCISSNKHLWSDDGKARRLGTEMLGAARVVGTIGVLKELTRLGDIGIDDAYAVYSQMRDEGAFFPNLVRDEFAPE